MKFFLLFFLLGGSAFADELDDLLHPAAHVGGAYAITHIGEVLCRKISNGSKTTCTLVGAALAIGTGIAVEAKQKESKHRHQVGLAEDLAGVGLAAVTIAIDF